MLSDGTFRPTRYHGLLAGPVVRWPTLATLQAAYAAAASDAERRAAAVHFLEAMRELEHEETEDPFVLELEQIFTAPPVAMTIAGDARAVERYQCAVEAAAAKADGWTIPRIAVRLGVSSTTVRRDLSWLERASSSLAGSIRGSRGSRAP
jgi:hypothetical protein